VHPLPTQQPQNDPKLVEHHERQGNSAAEPAGDPELPALKPPSQFDLVDCGLKPDGANGARPAAIARRRNLGVAHGAADAALEAIMHRRRTEGSVDFVEGGLHRGAVHDVEYQRLRTNVNSPVDIPRKFFMMRTMTITAKQIKTARQRAGETQEQFSKRFGVDRSTLAGWEANGAPRDGTAPRLIERVLFELAQQAAE
jgi:DNA-binding transcriptional regulator YiaG